MKSATWNPLLDIPAYPSKRYAQLADRIARLLGTTNPVLLVQAEAVVALEAVASSLAGPGSTAINIVTSPYGSWFGGWLRRGGTEVVDVVAGGGRPVTLDAVAAAIADHPHTALLSVVHAESASGILNPLPEIIALAREKGIVTIVDAVASVGGHSLNVDRLGIDIAVIGPQKALGGPAGLSALSLSPAARRMVEAGTMSADSILSVADLCRWHDAGRKTLPGTPAPLEFFALEAALDQVEAEGIEHVIERHARAGAASRAGLAALGVGLFVHDTQASNLVTAAVLPDGTHALEVIGAAKRLGVEITAGVGEVSGKIVRLNHTGPRASFDTALGSVTGYGAALRMLGIDVDIGAAAEAFAAVYLN